MIRVCPEGHVGSAVSRKKPDSMPEIIGRSAALRAALDLAKRFAKTPAPVLLLGETGTGKELMAQWVHHHSGRVGAFVAVGCPNLSEDLIESELFGHRRGAFTGAAADRVGLVEQAHGGTLFLDEIGDLPFGVQSKLLRFLQEGTIRRLGENADRRVEVRVVAATWRDLTKMVAERKFRSDLYQRLAWGIVELPPLRERGRDIEILARHFLKTSLQLGGPRKGLSRDASTVLVSHDWPGNVRELQRTLYQAAVQTRGPRVSGRLLSEVLGTAVAETFNGDVSVAILARLDRGACSARELAEHLMLSRSQLQRQLVALISSSVVEKIGRGNQQRYRRAVKGQLSALTSDQRHALVLRVIAQEGRVTRARLAREAGISGRTATRVLHEMVCEGSITRDGRGGRMQGYSLGPASGRIGLPGSPRSKSGATSATIAR